MQIVGVVTLFAWPAPMLLKQGYLIVTGVIVAFVFSGIPEWTTWALLLMMALYDIVAVLTPGGPLKVIPCSQYIPFSRCHTRMRLHVRSMTACPPWVAL